MERIKLLLITFLGALITNLWAVAAPPDTLMTVYEKGVFHTSCRVLAQCDVVTADDVVDDFIRQFRGDPELLFEWALKGVGKQNDSEKDAIILKLKSTVFDSVTSVGAIKTDIIVPGFTTFRDIDIESRVTKTLLPDGAVEVEVDVYYTNAFLKKAFGTYRIIPVADGQVLLTMDTYIRFGWFFDIFITKRRYRNLAEFRVQGFMDNMRTESERRMTENNG